MTGSSCPALFDADRVVVVAGNGPSLARLTPGRVLASDAVVRTNNFFFEPECYLGLRVDLAVMSGDPRVAPFMFETLWRHGRDYDIGAWTGRNPRVVAAGRRRFARQFRPFAYRDAHVERMVEQICARYGRKPTTGTLAVIAAHGAGARRIVMAGFDLHSGARRYIYAPGRNYRALMAASLSQPGPEPHLHDPSLDIEILTALAARDDLSLGVACESSVLRAHLPAAPVRSGPAFQRQLRQAPADWVGRVGAYPISMLRLFRRLRSVTRA
ncbi:hypothetical protein [Poseidonocella sedimentorum]|uniref:Alpha-2,3-sialyltransferase (CST-I) n=1 Tax=Poseidonocella sedimentorum TaxID=871652 RepID=A0A1I6ED34_9RHOB|nr:hypothetical protein [Poseidonocella sedimentorum]SFR15615.1 hypothetical protein SAMN04515673_11023 [Poseidonocella sedimentorum]